MANYPLFPAPSANNWRDHFTGNSLNGRWGSFVSGTGAVTVTDSYVELNAPTNSAAALYLGTKLDKSKSQLILACVSFPTTGTAGFAPYFMAIVNGAGTPAADTKNNWTARIISHRSCSNGTGQDQIVDDYFDVGNTAHYWDGKNASPAFTTTFANSNFSEGPIRSDDYYVCGLEIDGVNARFRWLGWGQSFPTAGTFLVNQGWSHQSMTDWVSWSSCRDSSNIWLLFGTPFNNDGTSNHVCRLEWARYSEATSNNTAIDSWAALKDLANSQNGQIRHFSSVDGEIFTPQDRTTWAIAVGAGGAWDESVTQEPWMVYDGATTDNLFYTGTNAGSVQAFGVATATHANPQNGPWTKYASNPILQVGTTGAFDDSLIGFPWVICDQSETDSNKRWKMLYAGKKAADGKWRTGLATAANAVGPWTKQGMVIDVGAGGSNDEKAARDVCCVWFGQWYVFYEAWDASGVTHLMYATAATLNGPFTKQGTYWTPAYTTADTTLTADLSAAPGRTVTVSDTSNFVQDQTVIFSHSTSLSTFDSSKVRKVVNGTTLELLHGVTGEISSYPSRVKAMTTAANMSPRAIGWTGTEWWFHINFWEPFFHQSYSASYASVTEDDHLAKHSNASPVGAAFALDYLASPTLSRSVFSGINSTENVTLMNSPFTGGGGVIQLQTLQAVGTDQG